MFALDLFNVFNISNLVVSVSLLSIVILLKRIHPKGRLVISDRLKYSFELLAVLLLFGNLVKISGVNDTQWVSILANVFSVISVTVCSLILYVFLFRSKVKNKKDETTKDDEKVIQLETDLEHHLQTMDNTLTKIQNRLTSVVDKLDKRLE